MAYGLKASSCDPLMWSGLSAQESKGPMSRTILTWDKQK